MNISEKLLMIQTELKAPKNQRNNFGGYNYRSAEDILEAVKPLLKNNKCQLILADEIVEVGGRIYVKATANFSDGENSITTTAFAREAETKKGMDESQITGTASSYARKYCLNGLFLIDDTKDADTDEYQNKDADTDEYQKTTRSKDTAKKPETDKGLDFKALREKYQGMTKEELRKEYGEVENYPGWSDKQREAVLHIITRAAESK